MSFLSNAWNIWQEVAPWLLGGLILAGLLKVFFPTGLLQRWLGGKGVGPISRAAIIGTPIPLCSCSVLPTAIQLHRSGASKGATASFLVATPENGADSIALSYVLLGPVMTILRPIAAVLSAVSTGMLAELVDRSTRRGEVALNNPASAGGDSSCCCGEDACDTPANSSAGSQGRQGNLALITNTALDLLDDIAGWLLVGILFAAALETFVPDNAMAGFGSGLVAMLVIAALSVPMYICATASTPVAASMLVAGISPGTVLVFLLAGPATNLASAAILQRELGTRVTAAYLVGVVGSSIVLGLLVDLVFREMDIHVTEQLSGAGEMIPLWISLPAAVLVALLAARPLRRYVWSSAS